MEIAAFVVAFVLIAGFALIRMGRTPFPAKRSPRATDPIPSEARTAEPPGGADDAG